MPIHPTAIVDSRAELDASVVVGPYCVIEGPVRIDADVRLYQNVYVTGRTHIGQGCVLHPGAIVGHEPQDIKDRGQPTFCRIGSRTVIREYVTIHRGTAPDTGTIVGNDCFLLAASHVGHNCVVGDGVTLINGVLLGGHVEVGTRATLGGAAVVHQFVRVGELVMVAGNARVVMDAVPFSLVDVEGRVAGLNRIGLRRAQLSVPEIEEVRAFYRFLFAPGRRPSVALEECKKRCATRAGQRLIAFVEAPSKRGLAGRPRRG
jgi:UDP-N-acetylglucosamine acyltransferase